MTVRRSRLAAALTLLVSGGGNQVGAAVGAHAFAAVGPVGVVAVRQLVAAAVLLPLARPRISRFTSRQWWPTLALAAVFAVMNLSLYTAVDRIGLALAVTLEFLGPLTVALATSRTPIDLFCAVGAATGVVLLVAPGPSSDCLGIGLALAAAVCWGLYIGLNRLLGQRLPGVQAPAVASSVSALGYLPVAAVLLARGQFTTTALLCAVGAGLLCSVLPYAADLIVLRRVPAHVFGVFMSVNPVLAALAGLVVLGQVLGRDQWAGLLVVVAANAIATSRRPSARGVREAPAPIAPAKAAPTEVTDCLTTVDTR